MGDDCPTAKETEERLREVTDHRVTADEGRIVAALLEIARRPFDIGRPTGDDPATRFRPAAPKTERPNR
ncbi:hypothetical protein [Pikeienuella sp. HZG-20]|uniref:hypothetical protein n=1 Tax=Paludibacillus litoralis TaxID=3133267 RepID=UPI0030EC244C